nr:hypothetical protein [uncultured Mucilaginibacter sp.]
MELDDLKSSWNSAVSQPKTEEELGLMLIENRHPVLKRIRRQIVIETAGWTVFLFCYYTMFDGADKPLIANAILIIAVLAALLHNLTGYNFSKNLTADADIKTAMQGYLSRMKQHAVITLMLRVLFIGGLLAFFCWNITLDSRRYILLGTGLALLITQLLVLYKIWMGRIRALNDSVDNFKG